MTYFTQCAQRGCTGKVEGEKPPILCPVCKNPLLKDGVKEASKPKDPPK